MLARTRISQHVSLCCWQSLISILCLLRFSSYPLYGSARKACSKGHSPASCTTIARNNFPGLVCTWHTKTQPHITSVKCHDQDHRGEQWQRQERCLALESALARTSYVVLKLSIILVHRDSSTEGRLKHFASGKAGTEMKAA